ncbi:MAG: 8-amino-7-oxononanoate synthase [Planctomycetota bacterium]|jgi:8-amino-7-oxononanoate synthase
MGSPLEQELAQARAERALAGLARTLDAGDGRGADFSSNDYLGLARDPRVVEAAQEALERYGAGGRAARLLGGGSPEHGALEAEVADWLGTQAALYFPSGYQANLGLVGALVGRGDAVITDRLDHASLIDAARLSRARILVHQHLDLVELEAKLIQARNARRRLVLTEGVFSMDGDLAPLLAMAELCAKRDAYLVIDEAHSIGLLGPDGSGAWAAACEEASVPAAVRERLIARLITGGKALGANGALVAGSRALIDELTDRARGFVFTTAAAPSAAAALRASIGIVRSDAALRARPLQLAKDLAEARGLPQPAAAIVPVLIGSSERAMDVALGLHKLGLDVRAVRPPTVPVGTARLRVVCHAQNTDAELEELDRSLGKLVPQVNAAGPATIATARKPMVVLGTDTDVGKTVAAAALFHCARSLGDARYWKPVQTGTDLDTETVAHLSGAPPFELLRPAWAFPLPASPHAAAADAGAVIKPERLDQALSGLLRTLPETNLVIELAGGLLVPYTDDGQDQADWVARVRPNIVLVARSGLGTLNHTQLTLEALRARHLDVRALILVGDAHPSNVETLRRISGVTRIIELPRLEPLTPGTLQAWADGADLTDLFE